MALIKHSTARDIARGAIVLDLGDLQRQGQALTRQAQETAAKIVADAHAERARIIAGADERGYLAGLERGLSEGRERGERQARDETIEARRQELDALAGAWGAALGEFAAARDGFLQSAERDVLRLALLIAERVTKRHIELDPGVVVEQLRAVLGVVARSTELVVRVHPDDRELVERALPALAAGFPAIRHCELAVDPALARGSCVARLRGGGGTGGDGGEIDASVGTQLDRIVTALLPDKKGTYSH